MTPEQHARAKALFLAACKQPADQREAYVSHECGSDHELRAEVVRLLKYHSADATVDASERSPSPSPAVRKVRFEPGQIVAERYRIVSLLGRGGMGEVYRADDTRLGQTVALKFLPAGMVSDASWMERFRKEVRIAREVTHPNVCRVFDIGDSAGGPFLSMEYVDGEDLKTLLQRIGRVPDEKAIHIARQLCQGLAAAHARGVLHRDLKPANVMIDGRGDARITDFGLAGAIGDFRGIEIRAGTPAYMSPEQISGREVTPRSDIYSVGLILYELFTGKPAFEAETAAALSELKTNSRPTPPTALVADVPRSVERVVMRCLEADPANRPESIMHVLAALPGGDLLEAALQAGTLPSPSLVAAAGGHDGLRMPIAITTFVVALMLLIAAMTLSPQVHPLGAASARKPAAVLAERAREIAAALGGIEPVRDEAYGFAGDLRLSDLADSTRLTPWSELRLGVIEEPVFWYRQAADYLISTDVKSAVYGGGRLKLNDPPHRVAGGVRIVLDGNGTLLGYARSAADVAAVGRAGDPERINETIAELARVELIHAGPASSEFAAIAAGDPSVSASAWSIPLEGRRADQSARVEIAIDHASRPRFFAITRSPPRGRDRVISVDFQTRAQTSRGVALLFLLLVSTPLALANLRRGRSDPQGALRLATVLFAIRIATWGLATHHVPELNAMLSSLLAALAGAVTLSLAAWVLYVALEPAIRRYWPQTLISWNRMLAGQFRDPLLGAHLLIGAVVGALWAVLGHLEVILPKWFGYGIRPLPRVDDVLQAADGTRVAVAYALYNFADATYFSMLLLLLVVLFRAWIKNLPLALLATAIVFVAAYLPWDSSAWAATLLLAGLAALGAWMLTRYGLISVIAAAFTCMMLLRFPLTLDLRVWYADLSLLAVSICAAIAAFGLWATLRRPHTA